MKYMKPEGNLECFRYNGLLERLIGEVKINDNH